MVLSHLNLLTDHIEGQCSVCGIFAKMIYTVYKLVDVFSFVFSGLLRCLKGLACGEIVPSGCAKSCNLDGR
jgi:hypothetical protein